MASIRTTLATAGTLAALGGLTAIALGAGDARPEAEPVGSQAPAEEVRTEVVTRTIRVDDDRGSAATSAVVPSSSPSGADDGHRGRGRDDRGVDDHRRGRRGGGGDDSDGSGRGRGGGRDDDAFDDHGRGRGGDDDAFAVALAFRAEAESESNAEIAGLHERLDEARGRLESVREPLEP